MPALTGTGSDDIHIYVRAGEMDFTMKTGDRKSEQDGGGEGGGGAANERMFLLPSTYKVVQAVSSSLGSTP
jgi:hypothetical protein